MSKVITIGREFGSGGRELGRRLAEELGIDYYDKEIITEISNHTSFSEEYIKSVLERRPHHLFPITVGNTFSASNDYYIQQMTEIYAAQTHIIRDLALRGDCVIIGRCADYILRELHPVRIFVYADFESRLERCMARRTEAEMQTCEREMRKRIIAVDKERAQYYNEFTEQVWGDKQYYDLCINTTGQDIKCLVSNLVKYFR